MESQHTDIDSATAELRARRDTIRRRRRVGLVVGAVLSFALGGFLGLFLALAVVAIARVVERSYTPQRMR